jgi:hypothetical protein
MGGVEISLKNRLFAMGKNLYRLWVVLLVVTGAIALWFSCSAAVASWKFVRLNAMAPAKVLHWEVKSLSSSRFAIAADYQFEVDGAIWSGKTVFEHPQFLNRYAAENQIRQLKSNSWETWYKKGNPEISSLEREFPQKSCLQALLTLGVFSYFYFARNMLTRLMD